MSRTSLLLMTSLLLGLSTGCKHHEEAAKQTGADLAAQNIQQPIDRAKAVTGAVAKDGPALLDTTAMVYHKPGCKYADPATNETLTVGQAEAKGGKPDPVCFASP